MFNEQIIRNLLHKYLKLGLNPIPLQGKVANYHWRNFKLTENNMKQYLRPGINWGLRTELLPSGKYFYVIDLDSKANFGEFYNATPLPEHTPIVSTGRGFHIYLSWSEPVKTKHFPGIDIIGNGYVVAPPSIHPSGKPYRFIVPLESSPPELNPEKCSAQYSTPLIIHVPLVDYAQGIQGFGRSEFAGVCEGNRHNTLVRYIGISLSRHFTEEETLTDMLAWNKQNKPPLPQSEVITTVRDCYERWDRYIPPVKPNK